MLINVSADCKPSTVQLNEKNIRYLWVSGKNRLLCPVLIVIVELIQIHVISRTYTCSIVTSTYNIKDITWSFCPIEE